MKLYPGFTLTLLEAKDEDGKIIISRGNIITLAPINARLKINAKYDAELAALENTKPVSDKKADIERRRQEDFNNENESYRVIVGDEAFNDIVESGVVRTNAETKSKKEGGIDLSNRPTAYPSFSKGKASMDYAAENPNNYIIVTDDSSIQPSKVGRHGKGTTMFPTDENWNHLKELSGEKIKVYKHIGNGEYILVYANGNKINAELAALEGKVETTKSSSPFSDIIDDKLVNLQTKTTNKIAQHILAQPNPKEYLIEQMNNLINGVPTDKIVTPFLKTIRKEAGISVTKNTYDIKLKELENILTPFNPINDEQVKDIAKFEGKNKAFLEYIMNNISQDMKPLAEMLMNNVSKLGHVKLQFGTSDRVGGKYNTETGELFINLTVGYRRQYFSVNEGLQNVLYAALHEYIHAYILNAFLNPQTMEEKEFSKFIKDTFKTLKKDALYQSEYGFKSEEEFISEIMANKDFRKMINKTSPSLWTRIKNFFAKLLGIGNKREALVDKTISTILEFIPKSNPVLFNAGEYNIMERQSHPNFSEPEEANVINILTGMGAEIMLANPDISELELKQRIE